MVPTNIVSVYQSIRNMSENKALKKYFKLSQTEAKTLESFCQQLKLYSDSFELFDGYYIGYSIKQISKEFDLLRFSDDAVINIELKSPLGDRIKIEKITNQMKQNYYYLKFLEKNIFIYTYIENDGLYKYDSIKEQCLSINMDELVALLLQQTVNNKLDPNLLFIPSNYLISPFNNTDKFINQEYFLTDAQQTIKKQIMTIVEQNQYEFFCISANAGTGKTLLLYDIAKTIIDRYNNAALIIHCGKLNAGHITLRDLHKWNVHSIADVNKDSVQSLIQEQLSLILIDESQRINSKQLDMIIEKSMKYQIPVVFSYDIKQYLSNGENLDLYKYITDNLPQIKATKRELTNKIRTNKEMASFITNLMNIGKSNSFCNYESVTIEFFDNIKDVTSYIKYLEEKRGWKAITYTTSRYDPNRLDYISSVCSTKAHDVIGQEFNKVVFVMDKNFAYSNNGELLARGSYYSAKGMFYQIVTRVINELKIIVLNNVSLYYKLLEIKGIDQN